MNALGKSMNKLIKIYPFGGGQVDLDALKLARDYLNNGGVIAVPTDTIYGLAARVCDSVALDRIYKIKGRDVAKPLSVCVSEIDEVSEIANTSKLDKRILKSLLPGPITILLERSNNLNKDLNPTINTIGVRIPNNEFMIKLCAETGPLALTSANRSGETSPLLTEDFKELWPELDGVFDLGRLQKRAPNDSIPDSQRLGSTVVDLIQPRLYTIVREGCALNRTINILDRYGYRRLSQKNRLLD